MKTLEYKSACKSCLLAERDPQFIMVAQPEKVLYENRYFKSEYQLTLFVQRYIDEVAIVCQNCGSNNLHISDIHIEGKAVLPGENTTQFQLVVIKHEDGQIELKTGGSKYLPEGFLKEAFQIIEDAINEPPEHKFENGNWGNARFVVATGFIGKNVARTNRLEQFNFVGFDKALLVEKVMQAKKIMTQ